MIGSQSTVDAALLCLRTGGTFVNMVGWRRNASVNMNFLFKEINVTGESVYNFLFLLFLSFCPFVRRCCVENKKFCSRLGAVAYQDTEYPEVIEALSEGKIQGIEELFTDRIEIQDIVEKGFHTLLNHGEHHSKRQSFYC
jgi:threonine dehydrogenase-like Zn-dependent dehydrogenase